MDRKELILTGKLKELDLSVFNKKLDSSSDGCYTDVLNEEEECMAVKQLTEGNSGFLYFLQKYQKHYPLCNEAVNLLIENISDKNSQQLLIQNFKMYGYNEAQGRAVCKFIEILDGSFLYTFCICAKMFYRELYNRLSLVSSVEYKKFSHEHNLPENSNWGELYKQSAENHPKN